MGGLRRDAGDDYPDVLHSPKDSREGCSNQPDSLTLKYKREGVPKISAPLLFYHFDSRLFHNDRDVFVIRERIFVGRDKTVLVGTRRCVTAKGYRT